MTDPSLFRSSYDQLNYLHLCVCVLQWVHHKFSVMLWWEIATLCVWQPSWGIVLKVVSELSVLDESFSHYWCTCLSLNSPTGRPATIGLCVSGQSSTDLRKVILNVGRFSSPVVLLIGSNDLRRDVRFNKLRSNFHRIILRLKCLCNDVVLLTILPAPALWGNEIYRRHLVAINRWLLKKRESKIPIFLLN